MTRRHWGGVVIAIWLVSLGWLVKREYFRPTGARLAEAALSVSPSALYYQIEARGRQVGFASTTIDTVADSIRIDDLLILEAPALGTMQRTTVRTTALLTRSLRLRTVAADVDGDGRRFEARGAVVDDTTFRLTLWAGSDSTVTRWPLAGPVVVPALLPLRLAFGGELKRGNAYTARLFDPTLLAEWDVRARVGDDSTFVVADSADYDSTAMAWVPVQFDTVQAFAVDQDRAGRRLRAWVDGQGRVVRAESEGGMVLQRSAFEIAYENFRHRDTLRLREASRDPPAGTIVPATAWAAGVRPTDTATQFRARIAGAPLAAIVTSDAVTVRGDTVEVRRHAGVPTPRRMRPIADSGFAAWLGTEPLIPVDDPRVAAQARQIVGRQRNAWRAAGQIVEWVHAEVRPGVETGVPGAVAALVGRRGDGNGQAALLVALARAAGIPARTVAGLLYTGGRFYYHVWAELYVGDWVPADPLLGQFPAGAGRIPLVVGGYARHVELAPLVASLEIEVL